MKLLPLAAAALCWPAGAIAQIDVPYFNNLSAKEVCGGFNRYCQPNSSPKFDRVRGADYADIAEWLGRSYPEASDGVFGRSGCVTGFAPDQDVKVSGENNFTATVDNRYRGGLRSKFGIDLGKYLGAVLSVLPLPIQTKLEADATDTLATATGNAASFTYRRLDLKMAAMDRLLPACFAKTNGRRKVITGVSVIAMSGTWTRQRLVDSFGKFEASADFIGLKPDIKAAYIDRRDRALAGTFEPMSFVIATSWRRQ